MSNRDIKKEKELVGNLVEYLENNAIYDIERNEIMEFLHYGGSVRFSNIFDDRDDRKPLAAIGKYASKLYYANAPYKNERECIAFRKKVRKALNKHYIREEEKANQEILDRWDDMLSDK